MPENIPGSHEQVKMTAVHPLGILIEEIRREIPGSNFVYDEKLSHETAVKKYRDDNNLNETDDPVYPLFAFRRTVLRHEDESGPGRRATSIFTKATKPSDADRKLIYRLVHGTFDLEFLYMDKDLDQIERFEIAYLGEEGISGIKELNVPFPEPIEQLTWFLRHDPLNDKQFEAEGNFYKAAGGNINVRGWYLILRGEHPVIKVINATLKDLETKKVTYDEININA